MLDDVTGDGSADLRCGRPGKIDLCAAGRRGCKIRWSRECGCCRCGGRSVRICAEVGAVSSAHSVVVSGRAGQTSTRIAICSGCRSSYLHKVVAGGTCTTLDEIIRDSSAGLRCRRPRQIHLHGARRSSYQVTGRSECRWCNCGGGLKCSDRSTPIVRRSERCIGRNIPGDGLNLVFDEQFRVRFGRNEVSSKIPTPRREARGVCRRSLSQHQIAVRCRHENATLGRRVGTLARDRRAVKRVRHRDPRILEDGVPHGSSYGIGYRNRVCATRNVFSVEDA